MTEVRRSPMTNFMLEVWGEPLDEGRIEWRGRIHHLASGNARYFREWSVLVEFLELSMVGDPGVAVPTRVRVEVR